MPQTVPWTASSASAWTRIGVVGAGSVGSSLADAGLVRGDRPGGRYDLGANAAILEQLVKEAPTPSSC